MNKYQVYRKVAREKAEPFYVIYAQNTEKALEQFTLNMVHFMLFERSNHFHKDENGSWFNATGELVLVAGAKLDELKFKDTRYFVRIPVSDAKSRR